MRKLIRKLLREEMLSKIKNYKENTSILKEDDTISVVTLISTDESSDDKLWLFVSFKNFGNYSEYSYSFIVTDKNNSPLTNYITKREDVSYFIPIELKHKKQIFPIIMDSTRKLMDEELPQNIYRKTVEPIEGNSLKRYEEITNIMVNEYGYKLIEYSKDKWGYTYWKLSRENVTDDNKNMNESYEITHSYTLEETLRQTNDCLLPKLSFLNLEPIFKK